MSGWPNAPAPHMGLEIRPIRFDIDLTRSVPSIDVMFYAVNYTRYDLELRELDITRFNVGSIPALDNVPLSADRHVPAMSSQVVYCRRNLLDSEARALSHSPPGGGSGSLAFVARAYRGRRETQYGPVSSIAVEGSIRCPAV